MNKSVSLGHIYDQLFKSFGPQHWWPGETRMEIIVGAILTQNTSWGNVERAIANLKSARSLSPQALRQIALPRLARLIRPSGYFNIKAQRLKNFIDFLFEEYQGSLTKMAKTSLPRLREKLLAVNGVGPETADSILLYAFAKPTFVVDAYTKRFLSRHGLVPADAAYREIQQLFLRHLPPNSQHYNEYHALIVRLGKDYCRPKPACVQCPLREVMGTPRL